MSEGTEISRVFGSNDIFMKIIQEVIKLGKLTSILPILAFIGSTCKSWKVAVEQDELWYLLFRAYYPRVNSARWASDLLRSGWKKHFLALSPVRSVVLWVEDDTYTVRAYAEHIRKSPIHLKHAQSTEEAKAWLTTHLEALHPTLHIITDNVRQEAAPDGSLSNNYNAGRELIEWLNAEGNGFADAPVMLFCGNGSIPFIKDLTERFSTVTLDTDGRHVLNFAMASHREQTKGMKLWIEDVAEQTKFELDVRQPSDECSIFSLKVFIEQDKGISTDCQALKRSGVELKDGWTLDELRITTGNTLQLERRPPPPPIPATITTQEVLAIMQQMAIDYGAAVTLAEANAAAAAAAAAGLPPVVPPPAVTGLAGAGAGANLDAAAEPPRPPAPLRAGLTEPPAIWW